MRTWKTLFRQAAAITLLLLVLLQIVVPRPALGAEDGWVPDPTFHITLLGRDGPEGKDHYRITARPGAAFFGIADSAMPLEPTQQTVDALMEAFAASHPDRPRDFRYGDSFDLYVPQGTLVGNEWRRIGRDLEFRSLRGDILRLYTDPRSLILYRLARAENPQWHEIKVNRQITLDPYALAQTIYGPENPDFKPDFLQVLQAQEVIRTKLDVLVVDSSRSYLDDFRQVRDSSRPGGESAEGLSIYHVESDELLQTFFRVDDGIGDVTDPKDFPSLVRIYYYKNGVIRTLQKASDSVWVSGRQPKADSWTKVYAEYGRLTPSPSRWSVGQPEESDQARQLSQLGITVLRYEPQAAPQGNFLTQIMDFLMGLMSRKS